MLQSKGFLLDFIAINYIPVLEPDFNLGQEKAELV